jgi:hypothetical protein
MQTRSAREIEAFNIEVPEEVADKKKPDSFNKKVPAVEVEMTQRPDYVIDEI